MFISWNGTLSDYFLAVNGVKRHGVLSPVIFFSIYIDGSLVTLSQANVGCYVGEFFVGVLAYADDIVLLAPTASAMRQLLLYIWCLDDSKINEVCTTWRRGLRSSDG